MIKDSFTKKLLEKRQIHNPSLVGFFLVLLLFILVYLFFGSRYNVNDDIAMSLWAQGRWLAPTPDPHLIFSHYFIGYTLKFFYEHFPSLPWYGLYLYVTVVVSYFIILRVLLFDANVLKFALILALMGSSFFLFLAQVTFTFSAGLLTQAGIILLIHELVGPKKSIPLASYICASCLVLSGFLVRGEASLSIIFLALPILCIIAWNMPEGAKLKILAAFSIQTIILIAAAALLDTWYYKSNANWASFAKYKWLVSQFNDFDRVHYNAATKWVFDRVGWSQTDFEIFRSAFYSNPGLFSLEKVSAIVKEFPFAPSASIGSLISELARCLSSDHFLQCALLLFFATQALVRGRKNLFVISVLSGSILIQFGCLLYVGRFIDRVYLPQLSFLSITALCLTTRQPQITKPRIAISLTCLLVLFGCLAGLIYPQEIERSRSYTEWNSKLKTFVQDSTRPRSAIFLAWGTAFPWFLRPLDSLDPYPPLAIYGIGATTRSVYNERWSQIFRIEDIYRDLIKRRDIFIFAAAGEIDLLSRYLREHYHEDVSFERKDIGGLTVFQSAMPTRSPLSEK